MVSLVWLFSGLSGCWNSAEHCGDRREEGGSAGAAHSVRLYVGRGVVIDDVVGSVDGVRSKGSVRSR